METTVQTHIAADLVRQAEKFVQEGGAKNLDALIEEALRRHLESHSTSLAETFLREDVAWGLRGDG